jgi:hypothetical protein
VNRPRHARRAPLARVLWALVGLLYVPDTRGTVIVVGGRP